MLRPDRDNRGPDRWLEVKLALFMLGAVVGVAGMYFGSTPTIYVAIAILVIGFLLRFAPRGDTPGDDAPEPDDRPAE